MRNKSGNPEKITVKQREKNSWIRLFDCELILACIAAIYSLF